MKTSQLKRHEDSPAVAAGGRPVLRFLSVNLGSRSVAKDDDDAANSLKVDTVERSVAAVSASRESHRSEGDGRTPRQIDRRHRSPVGRAGRADQRLQSDVDGAGATRVVAPGSHSYTFYSPTGELAPRRRRPACIGR